MISVSEALDLVLRSAPRLSQQDCDLAHLCGRVLAEPVCAPHDSPPFDNSAMDGFAVRSGDLAGASAHAPVMLPIQGEVTAGCPPKAVLRPGHALRINTGAALPSGADAVVRIEDAVVEEGGLSRFLAPVAAGTAVRRVGEDSRIGQVMIESGRRLDPVAVGLIASMGLTSARVARKPRVALVATGDELVEPGRPLLPGQIYNSTRHALIPLLHAFGAEVHDLGTAPDDEAATLALLRHGLSCDVLVTTGGVSMGNRDLVRPALLNLGVREVFWKVRQRPGKPLFFGVADQGGPRVMSTLCFGLPGNPVSVFITAVLYVRTALLAMQGASKIELPWSLCVVGTDIKNSTGLTVFMRVNRDGNKPCPSGMPVVMPSPAQGSHQFGALDASAGIIRLGESDCLVPQGASIDFLDFRTLLA